MKVNMSPQHECVCATQALEMLRLKITGYNITEP